MTDIAPSGTAPRARPNLRNYLLAGSFAGTAAWLTPQFVDFDAAANGPDQTWFASDTTSYSHRSVDQIIVPESFETRSASANLDPHNQPVTALVLSADDVPTAAEQQIEMLKALIDQSSRVGLYPLYRAISALSRNDVLWHFLRILGEEEFRSRMAEALPLLMGVLHSPDAGARSAAASSLAAFGTSEALAALRERLQQEQNRFVRHMIETYVS